jgi:hypothetical protein
VPHVHGHGSPERLAPIHRTRKECAHAPVVLPQSTTGALKCDLQEAAQGKPPH